VQAADSFFFLQREKADTRCRKKNESTACEAAPELVFGPARKHRTAHAAGRAERHSSLVAFLTPDCIEPARAAASGT
jgi:hypothetical protein